MNDAWTDDQIKAWHAKQAVWKKTEPTRGARLDCGEERPMETRPAGDAKGSHVIVPIPEDQLVPVRQHPQPIGVYLGPMGPEDFGGSDY